ncbi:titin isoform X2 [Aphidius gifuensis]|uniref:titin isoform X2 n=1 Tax=Aphidius gifuensis TaxID=684658 RepID=UPI001CDC258C|nr:titin isoform X2 [Aphidius gifuensis]
MKRQSSQDGSKLQESMQYQRVHHHQYHHHSSRHMVHQEIIGQERDHSEVVMTASSLPVFTGHPVGPSAPVFEKIFRNSKFVQGGNVIFDGKVSGNPNPIVSWTHRGVKILQSQKIKMSYDEQTGTVTLQINQIGPGDEGEYTCSARNQYGEAICSVFIQPEGFGAPLKQDFKDYQQRYSQTTNNRFENELLSKTTAHTTTTTNNGEFKVDSFEYRLLRETEFRQSITNRHAEGSDSRTSSMKNDQNLGVLLMPPRIGQKPRNSKLMEGSEAVFTAKIYANPTAQDGVPISSSFGITITADDTGSSTLEIACAKLTDASWYQCTAQNVAGSTATRARLFVNTPKAAVVKPRRLNLPRPTRVIEPEPTSGPEVIYLKHIERAKPSLPPIENDKIYHPPRFIVPLIDVHQIEGGRIHLEAKIEPLGDPTLRVEWSVNGKALEASARVTCLFRFGYISLDLLNVVLQDNGKYVCRLTSSTGVAESHSNVSITSPSINEKCSSNSNSRQYIQQLEDSSEYQKQESINEFSSQSPVFIRKLQELSGVEEGKNAHFEGQLIPVSDPTMKVEWYKDGNPIIASSRISTIFNFGYISLNIMHLRAEDMGTYTARAINHLGEATSTASLSVSVRSCVTNDLEIAEQQKFIDSAVELKSHQRSIQPRDFNTQNEELVPPKFKSIILDQTNIREGGFAHFEARLEPIGDANLYVEWLKNNVPIEASSRITTFFNFGYVALTLKYVTVHDVGIYTCRAYNKVGEDRTTAQLTVISNDCIIYDSQHPSGLQKMQHLEDSSQFSRQVKEECQITQKPRFLGHLKGTNKIIEGQRAHFEVRVEPQSDLGMKVEWYHDGNPITAANRIQTYYDFGYAAIDILQVQLRDAGTYSIVAKNTFGEAKISATMSVEAHLEIDTTSRSIVSYEKTMNVDKNKRAKSELSDDTSKSKPRFTQTLKDSGSVSEGKNIHFECRLEPMGDPSMRVEWFQNDQPVTIGSRFKTYYDFGYVALDIIHATCADSGEYTVRATNQLGTAQSSAHVQVTGKSGVITNTGNEYSLEQIRLLENSSKHKKNNQDEIMVMQVPQFTRPLNNVEIIELTNVHLECRLQPVQDTTMKVEWFVNGHPVTIGHRFRPSHEFDYIALDILGVHPNDSGVYTCQAKNQIGEAVTSCSVRVHAKKDLLLDTQHSEGLEKIQYLEDLSKYKRHEMVEEIVNIKPKFITTPKNQENLEEGQHAHFECKLEPVTDSNLKVEWFRNRHPITIGHRFRPIHDFGYVALDVIDLIAEDSGMYTCKAINLVGSDEVNCHLSCRSTAQILTDTQNETCLKQMNYLEDRSKYFLSRNEEEITTQSPIFTTSLKSIEIKEGQRAHFECRLIPVSDMSMKVEWFHDNKPVKVGSRFVETNNFGFVTLDIMYAHPEDSGTYICRAKNLIGEAITSATAVVHSKKSISIESQREKVLYQLQYLEESSRHKNYQQQEESVSQSPIFTMPIKDLRVAENQAAHFEARVIPVGDVNLKVEWIRNGIPIEASNRITTMHDFGYVALNMKYVNPEDSGTYICRARNDLGEAVTSATLFVQSKAALQLETHHETALPKIKALEQVTTDKSRQEEDISVKEQPRFTVRLNGPTKLAEGQSAHYECRLEPYPDATMKVEWFYNSKPLSAGHRYRTIYDFGFASLDILTVYAEDSGIYTCIATNKLGTSQSSIELSVISRASIIHDTHHEGALKKIKYLENDERTKSSNHEDTVTVGKPKFGRPLKNIEHLPEGKSAHLEATLIPVNDPTMVVEWFKNGKPIPQGHKFKTTYDFGYVALDILYAYSEDSGTYMCKARNIVGEAVTTCIIGVDSREGLCMDTLDAQRLAKIRELEMAEIKTVPEKELFHQKPVFLSAFCNLDHIKEGDRAHLECRIEPINDPHLKIEWFVNGVPLKAGHRFRTTHDFGYIALDILYAYSEDSGTYMCKATNLTGEAVNTCTIRIGTRRSILFDTQHPDGFEKIRELEAQGHPVRLEVEEPLASPPQFVTELHGTTEIFEGQSAHFECQISPLHDANLRVEFFHNGKSIPSASRFHVTFDFGYAALDISHAVPEDGGEYTVQAMNSLGMCSSSRNLKIISRENVITDSQRPEGLIKIQELELQQLQKKHDVIETQTCQRPVFTQPLKNIEEVVEGTTAFFECRLIPVGDPTLQVEWCKNSKLLEDSSRITKIHDFGYVSLEISHIREQDEGIYMCKAVNSLGEAVSIASMKIRSKPSIELASLHPEAQKKIAVFETSKINSLELTNVTFEKPIFTQLLTGPNELWESQTARFECRVVPVGDASLKFLWFVNGIELKIGSRIHENHEFGFVALEIRNVIPEDSGVYSCQAINNAGDSISSISLKVKARSAIDTESVQPFAWQKIQLKEAEINKVPEMFVDMAPQQAPVFTSHLNNFDTLCDGQHVYIEAQVEPRADPHLRTEWFKNGVPLQTGTRLRSTFDFGLVTLSINNLRTDDSAIYTCKATNHFGEAVSTCSIKVNERPSLITETFHPDAISKLNALEQSQHDSLECPEPEYDQPIFINHLNNVVSTEGENVHFECQVEPSKDPTMKIEWFINGKMIPIGARFKSTYDFGQITLDINHTGEEDSGVVTVKATNSKGSAQTTGTLKCLSKENICLQIQHPQGSSGYEEIHKVDEASKSKYKKLDAYTEEKYSKPVWELPLKPEFKLCEGEPLHLEGKVIPKEDPNLRIEWYFNGKILEHGSRLKMSHEFGFATLDLINAYDRDSGIYTCKAYNSVGDAFTSATVYCSVKENIIESLQHPKGKKGLEAIQNLEETLKENIEELDDSVEGHPPIFTSQFENLTNLFEGEIAHFEASLTPTGDQTMKVEWFYNGKPLEASYRSRTVYAFGMVVLEVLGTKVTDSGAYTCRASNRWGQAEISVILTCLDKCRGQKPKFTTEIQPIEALEDGQSVHFECTLIPADDPDMKVEWFHNGQPLRHSSRFKMVSDFGFVVIDIAGVMSHDSGEYICKASNKFGEDSTKVTIKCIGKSNVHIDSLQPGSLKKIQELESNENNLKATSNISAIEPPKFISHIVDITKLNEGQSAHFEARLTPIDDPHLKVDWYYNGLKLPHGHRYRTFHDFGIVILDILYCYEENSGVYECRAVNKYGEDSTVATLTCLSKSNLILYPQLPKGMEKGLEKIQNLEDSTVKSKNEKIDYISKQAPMFTVPLCNIHGLREGESAHFEGRLTPTDDQKLKVEWFWNGKPLKTGSRFRTFCDFGFVILEISPIYPEDSGEYSCRATNDNGDAVTSCVMHCTGKRSIILESQLPGGMEGTIQKIAEIEGFGVEQGEPVIDDDTGRPPEFVTHLSDFTLSENSLAHFECRLLPVNDSSMRVEWYHNGKPLNAGSRIKTIHDFGFVILEIANCYQRDSGMYKCKATNRHGEAIVTCKLQIRGRQGIILEPQLPNNFKSGTESIQKLEESLYKKDEIVIAEESPIPPQFTLELKDIEVEESEPSHFDCRVEPLGDPTMRIDWFHNGKPFKTGSRVHMIHDFGFISLDLSYTYARDSGEYICRATNKWGSVITRASMFCKSKNNIDFDSQLPSGMSGEQLQKLEIGHINEPLPEVEPLKIPPKFITQIQSITVEESESVRFECRIMPKDDPTLRIEWYRNGKIIPCGHRYQSIYDLGFVSMVILYVYPEDSGEYVCRAINDWGEDITKASVTCKTSPSIILQNQVPKGMKKSEALMQMEATIKKYTSKVYLTADDFYDIEKQQPPRFVTNIENRIGLEEMNSTKFECQLAPVGDPNMKLEWFFNGKPLPYKNRFAPIYDFGYVAMNFSWIYPEDSGEYLCRASNLYGSDQTKAFIETSGKPGIIYESQLPKGMKSIEKIREMEAAWQITPEEEDEKDKIRTAPVFVSKPEAIEVEEGDSSRFCCRVTGYPKPRVIWLINGRTVINGSRYKLTYDGMYHLDIPKTRQYDQNIVEVVAKNSVGEARCETTLTVKPNSNDYRGVLKSSPRPWYNIGLDQYQTERNENELERVFDERTQAVMQGGGTSFTTGQIGQKVFKRPETEWQKSVKSKKNENYYNKLGDVEEEQILKESKLRQASHQLSLLQDETESRSLVKHSVKKYDESLENSSSEVLQPMKTTPKKPFVTEVSIDSKKIADKLLHQDNLAESGVHGREVHVLKKQQTQKQTEGDREITRFVTEIETTDVEHSAKIHERVVQGEVKPAVPPIFTKKIQPCRAFEQEQAKFEVEFDGDPLPSIKWFRENFLIQNSSDMQIHTFSTKSVLIIRQVFIEDSAVFSVFAENRGGTAKCSANLVVEERRRQPGRNGIVPPNFITTIQNTTAKIGQLIRFDAKISGTKPIDVYWLKNGKKISPDVRYKMLEEDNIHTLLVLETVSDDTSELECVALNTAGEARCKAKCIIQEPHSETTHTPDQLLASVQEDSKILEPLQDQTIKEGNFVEFSCRISCKPLSTVQWKKNDKVIKPSKYFQMKKLGDRCTLRITEAFPEDEGVYKCIVNNPAGDVITTASLTVLAPESTDISLKMTALQDQIVEEGQSAQFNTCISPSKSKPTVQWYRDGTLIPQSADFQMILEGNKAVLLIATTYEEDSGTFACRATSLAGTVETSAKLVVKSKK